LSTPSTDRARLLGCSLASFCAVDLTMASIPSRRSVAAAGLETDCGHSDADQEICTLGHAGVTNSSERAG
jgi:hypothetical protein